MENHSKIFENELEWLESLFKLRKFSGSVNFSELNADIIHRMLDNRAIDTDVFFPKEWDATESLYYKFIESNNLDLNERILLILALCPHLKPELLHNVLNEIHPSVKEVLKNPAVGGIELPSYRGILPTGLTFLYLAAGTNLHKRIELLNKLKNNSLALLKKNYVILHEKVEKAPLASGLLSIHPEILDSLLSNQ